MNESNPDRYLITGGYGFIGSSLSRILLKSGHYLCNIDKLTYSSNLNAIEDLDKSEKYIFHKIDICDDKKLFSLIENFKPNKIVHLAAETHVDRSIDKPSDFIKTNVYGTYNLLNAAYKYWNSLDIKEKNMFKFCLVSTDEVYGSLASKEKAFDEESPYKPNSPYSASKAAADHLGRAWFKTYNLPVIITNTSNNFGPWQFPEKLIPLTILKCISNQKIPIYGSGEQVRDWIFVDDHSRGIISAIKYGDIGEKYNISSENELQNITVVKNICLILDRIFPRKNGNYDQLIEFVEDRPGHDQRYALNNDKIKKLNWQPQTNWLEGLETTIRWYLDHQDFLKNYSGERLGRS
ncbi:MAG: dTDP-glucose 4,6-dehydratase [Gammaproteobacteria bacterium]|nr:dTDP-glucose 4,6-dehydratase [Gammaproteobacteria bacterium]